VSLRTAHPALSPCGGFGQTRALFTKVAFKPAATVLHWSMQLPLAWSPLVPMPKPSGKKPIARVVAAAVAGVPPEIMGIGPAPAIRLLLARTGLNCLTSADLKSTKRKALELWPWDANSVLRLQLLNVNGGAIALGHATGRHRVFDSHRHTGTRIGPQSANVMAFQALVLVAVRALRC